MNAQERTEEIIKLQGLLSKIEGLAEIQHRYDDATVKEIKDRLKAIEDAHHTLGKSVAVLEAGSTILWRVAPLALSAVAIVVSIVLFLLKKPGQ